jgi:hypothetical protein
MTNTTTAKKLLKHTSIVTGTLLVGLIYGCGPSAAGEGGTSADDAGAQDAGPTSTTDARPSSDAGTSADTGPSALSDARGDACGGTDDPDDEGLDTNCDGVDGVVGRDTYVDDATGSDSNPGTPTRPMKTIAAAVTAAGSTKGRVLVARGSYGFDKDTLAVPGTWSLYGGYPSSFAGTPKRQLTVLNAGAAGLLVDAADDAKLVHMTIVGASGTDKQLTSHALRAKAKRLVLDDVVVQAGDGLSGLPGVPGAPGASGLWGHSATAGAGGDRTPMDCGTPTDSYNATGAQDPFANAAGKPPANLTTHTFASNGDDGIAGTDGLNGARMPVLTSDVLGWKPGLPGGSDATAGFGGAGGADTWSPTTYYLYGGGGGAGGCAGKGGGGGEGGGGSVAIVVLDGTLEITRSVLQTGFGGTGGAGGVGGAGGAGGWGGKPSQPGKSFPDADKCTTATDPSGYGCVAYGGRGGTGGDGGHGGGGAGGWTLGIVTVKSAVASVDSVTTIKLGKPGTGGASGASGRAPDGESRGTFHID